MSRVIRIDDAVAAAIVERRLEGESVNATVRRLLGLPADDETRASGGLHSRMRFDSELRRDATPAELETEPDGVLESMAAGDLSVTETTRHLAQAELDHRRTRR